MPLDLTSLDKAVEEMTDLALADDRSQGLARARRLLHDADPHQLREKLLDRTLRVPWLVAVPLRTLDAIFAPPDCPVSYTAVAADGSSVAPDRHSPVRYYVINTGHAVLTYGDRPKADLDSSTRFYFRSEDMCLDPLAGAFPVEGARLSAKMSVAELEALWRAAKQVEAPVVALGDGSLILWGLQNEDPRVQAQLLGEFLRYLDEFRALHIPVVNYISYPGARDVINSLRAWLCGQEAIDCSSCSSAQVMDTCRTLVWILDRQLFGFLRAGERSDIFDSTSAILDRYGVHRIQFFYMEVGGEVARIEAPQWVMGDSEMLGLIQAVLFDQCRRSMVHPSYPPALQEAHERAVISGAERRLVEALVERALARKGAMYATSAKDRSKRSRAV